MSPASYSAFCGPRAMQAVFDTPTSGRLVEACARDLLAVQRERGTITAPSTDMRDLAIALARHGFELEPWNVATGERAESAADYAIRLQRELVAHSSGTTERPPAPPPLNAARLVIEQAGPEEQARLWATWYATAAGPPLRQWLARPGLWILTVLTEDHHALTVRDGGILAGDYPDGTLCGDKPLAQAYRVKCPP